MKNRQNNAKRKSYSKKNCGENIKKKMQKMGLKERQMKKY